MNKENEGAVINSINVPEGGAITINGVRLTNNVLYLLFQLTAQGGAQRVLNNLLVGFKDICVHKIVTGGDSLYLGKEFVEDYDELIRLFQTWTEEGGEE